MTIPRLDEGGTPSRLAVAAGVAAPDVTGGRCPDVHWPRRALVLQAIDVPRVLAAAERAQARIEFAVGTGETIREGGRHRYR